MQVSIVDKRSKCGASWQGPEQRLWRQNPQRTGVKLTSIVSTTNETNETNSMRLVDSCRLTMPCLLCFKTSDFTYKFVKFVKFVVVENVGLSSYKCRDNSCILFFGPDVKVHLALRIVSQPCTYPGNQFQARHPLFLPCSS